MFGWFERVCIAIGLCTLFMQWELHVDYPNNTGWAMRWPDKATCERELARYNAHGPPPELRSFGRDGQARCIAPWEQ